MALVPGLYNTVCNNLINLADQGTTQWKYFDGGKKPTSLEDFWGDLIIYAKDHSLCYTISLFCGNIRHEIAYNTYNGSIERKLHSPDFQPSELKKLVNQIWVMDQARGINLIPDHNVYAIQGRKDTPDSEENLQIGQLAQQCFSNEGHFYLKTSLNMASPGFTRIVTMVINGKEVPLNDGCFYSKAIYQDWLDPKKRTAKGTKALGEIKSCLDKGERKICMFGGIKEDAALDTYYGIQAYLRDDVKQGHPKVDKPYFEYHCSWRGVLFIRNGIAILSANWPLLDFDLWNIKYPVYTIPEDEFNRLNGKMQMLYHGQQCKKY